MTLIDRRAFLGRGAVAGAGLVTTVAFERLATRSAEARHNVPGNDDGYGPLAPIAESGSDGRQILALPEGFSYVVFGEIGSIMSDGNPTPLALDGMRAFQGLGRTVRLIRNHEDRNPSGSGSVPIGLGAYDETARGGTTTLDYDPKTRKLVRDFVSLSGTTVNCAGGATLGHRGWISGEETTAGPERTGSAFFPKRHGYNFEVPLDRAEGDDGGTGSPPLVAMGRFAHEACATDQRTGIVYQTEDAGSGQGSGFYRYIPTDPEDLAAGGRLQMLAIRRRPRVDLRENQRLFRQLPVDWVNIEDVDPAYPTNNPAGSVFNQGLAGGGATFNRLEGCYYGDDSVYFASTSGGDIKNGDVNSDQFREGYGQIWQYRVNGKSDDGRLRLVYESTGSEALDSPDNLCVTPRGGLILCEDDASSTDKDTHPLAPGIEDVNRLIGFGQKGQVFEFAVNRLNNAEFAGSTFSPDGKILFVNIFGESRGPVPNPGNEGMTIAITGPWRQGPL